MSWSRIGLTSATKGTSEMNQETQPVTPAPARRGARDGLAAVAIALLTIGLMVFLVSKII
jgi:hypothetical protein